MLRCTLTTSSGEHIKSINKYHIYKNTNVLLKLQNFY